jgi:hypothetical protein
MNPVLNAIHGMENFLMEVKKIFEKLVEAYEGFPIGGAASSVTCGHGRRSSRMFTAGGSCSF